jgi:hypothetical protein
MDDEFILKPSKFFLEQVEALSDKAARIVEEKVRILKIKNPTAASCGVWSGFLVLKTYNLQVVDTIPVTASSGVCF